jgi:hypothetical protein
MINCYVYSFYTWKFKDKFMINKTSTPVPCQPSAQTITELQGLGFSIMGARQVANGDILINQKDRDLLAGLFDPKTASSGLPSGKRRHKPFTIALDPATAAGSGGGGGGKSTIRDVPSVKYNVSKSMPGLSAVGILQLAQGLCMTNPQDRLALARIIGERKSANFKPVPRYNLENAWPSK